MSKAIARLAVATIAVEKGFLAAGITITIVTLIQSVGIVTNWLH